MNRYAFGHCESVSAADLFCKEIPCRLLIKRNTKRNSNSLTDKQGILGVGEIYR